MSYVLTGIAAFVMGLLGVWVGALIARQDRQEDPPKVDRGTKGPAIPSAHPQPENSPPSVALAASQNKESAPAKRSAPQSDPQESAGQQAQEVLALAQERQKLLAQQHELQRALEEVAGLSQAEAAKRLETAVYDKARAVAAQRLDDERRRLQAQATQEAQKILATAICRLANEFVAESTVTAVSLPSDDMKGRIIGREGRNIRCFEAATGVDVIIDDTPEVVVLSAFNPERRALAKIALEQLLDDGRVHPARIEEVVAQARQSMGEVALKKGAEALLELGVRGMDEDLVTAIGRLDFRNIGGQNLWQHAMQTAWLGQAMAESLGVSPTNVVRAALLFGIGRCDDQSHDGDELVAAIESARRHGEKGAVLDILEGFGQAQPAHLEAIILQAAELLSRSRPGLRRQEVKKYVHRMAELEAIASGFSGVTQAFAIQAGQEIRVAVDAEKVSDQEAYLMSLEIAAALEQAVDYPGEIMVNVLRSAQASAVAT